MSLIGNLDLPGAATTAGYHPIPAPRLGNSQNVSYNASGGAAVSSTAFNPLTFMVEINLAPSSSGTGVRIAIGVGAVATGQSKLLIPGSTCYYKVYPGEVLSAVSNDGNSGSVNVVECAAMLSSVT